VEVKSLPAWAGEDAASATRPRQYVFRDANGEMVVSYPHPSSPGRAITFRFWLANRVDPHISVSVTRSTEANEAGFIYTYAIQNGSSAATAIRFWSVVGPADQDSTVSHPVWRGTKSRLAAAPQALLPNVPAGAYLSWMGADTRIPPGAEVRNFTIRSMFAPGLTTSYSNGEGAIISEPGPGELPEVVVQQLIPLQRAPVWQMPAITIGPRFAPGTPPQAVIEAFRKDVADLIKESLLSSTSPYVQELQQVLANTGGDASTKVFLRKVTPATQLEKDLDAALRMSISPPR